MCACACVVIYLLCGQETISATLPQAPYTLLFETWFLIGPERTMEAKLDD